MKHLFSMFGEKQSNVLLLNKSTITIRPESVKSIFSTRDVPLPLKKSKNSDLYNVTWTYHSFLAGYTIEHLAVLV